MLRMTADQIFPRKRKEATQETYTSGYKVPGYTDTENMWEYLCQIGIVRTATNYKASTASLYKSLPATGAAAKNPPAAETETTAAAEEIRAAREEIKEAESNKDPNAGTDGR